MPKNTNSCDCELCLYKTFPIDNPLLEDKNKIIEAIIYHFIFRLGNLVKSKKELNSHIVKFITMVNHHYLTSSDESSKLKETIHLIDKKISDSGKGCHFSTNTTLNKHIQKEATYLKLIISSMEDNALSKAKEVISPIEIKQIEEEVKQLEKDITRIEEEITQIEEEEKVIEEKEKVIEEKVIEEKVIEEKVIEEMVDVILEQPNKPVIVESKSYCIIS